MDDLLRRARQVPGRIPEEQMTGRKTFPAGGATASVLLAAFVSASVCRAQEPIATLPGRKATRLDAREDDTTPVYVMRTGRETLEWTLPETEPGVYRIEMTVRTGNTSSNPVNIVPRYRLWTVAADGAEGEPLAFRAKPGMTPVKTSEQWPHYVGDIVGTSALKLAAGARFRVTTGVSWSEVREVRLLPAREEDYLDVSLSCDQPWDLFRLGESVRVTWRVSSRLGEPVSVSADAALETPYGETVQKREVALAVPAGGSAVRGLTFTPTLRGPHVVHLEATWRGHTYTVEKAVLVVSVPPATELSAQSPFGVHSAGLSELYQCGFKWVRLWDTGDTWNRHERAGKGQFDFSMTDTKVDRFLEQGFRVLAVLAYTPTWASTHPEIGHYTGAGAPFPPRNIDDWRDYCRTIMTHYRGRIAHFEVWNEPNTGSEANLKSGFFRGTTDDYVALLKAAYEVARDVGPEIRIVGCSGTGDFLSWTERVLDAGGAPYMDILSFHAYTTPRSPEEANLGGRIERLRQIMAAHGIGDMPVWNTEVGYWTDRRTGARPATADELLERAPPGLAPNWQSGWPYRPITEQEAAAFTVRHYAINWSHGVDRLFWYSSISSGQPLLTADGGLRLACGAVAHMAETLDGARYLRRIDLGIKHLHLHLWQRGDDVVAMLWHAGRGVKDVEFPAGAALKGRDMWGNSIPLGPAENGVVVSAGRDPVFLTGRNDDFADVRLLSRKIVIPVDDCTVVREVNPERPVKNHTSPLYHGDRRVYGLPDAGDMLGWVLRAVKPGDYIVRVELRTGSAGDLYGALGGYEVSVKRKGGGGRRLRLVPVRDETLAPEPVGTPEGRGRAYGYAEVDRPVFLASGDEICVANVGGFGFVGSLMLCEADSRPTVNQVPVLASVPRLDGTLSEVSALPALVLDDRSQVVIGVADAFASTTEHEAWAGPADLSARAWLAACPDGLYVAVEVTDGGGLFPAARGAFNGDCVEVFFDLRGEGELGSAAPGDGVYHAMVRAPGADQTAKVEHRPVPGTTAAVRRTDTGWSVEFLIPATVSRGQQFGFDVAVDDDDTGSGRKSQIVWHGTADNFQDPSNYGLFGIAE
jgi:hypothetical protein